MWAPRCTLFSLPTPKVFSIYHHTSFTNSHYLPETNLTVVLKNSKSGFILLFINSRKGHFLEQGDVFLRHVKSLKERIPISLPLIPYPCCTIFSSFNIMMFPNECCSAFWKKEMCLWTEQLDFYLLMDFYFLCHWLPFMTFSDYFINCQLANLS